ncbi:hypothetical protein O181_097547 [Austropuccinia psidii MF-1]|uniref:Uncharacterized protein n=1 Tax=Austropuccinia psidii MF-1 TaxID=1389203 RepID=A0A9Q3J8R3_9BASI|nr:hypothetical protein [Austropuccinia psidii MF-1]
MWLHLVCGLSKLNCQRARDCIVESFESVSRRFGFDHKFISSIPHDVRTISKHLNLQPSLEQYVCCPKCFSLYDIKIAPDDCGYQASSKGQPCGAGFFKKNTFLGSLKPELFSNYQKKKQIHHQSLIRLSRQRQPQVPILIFVTQSVTPWLKWFLNLHIVEECIDQWAHELEAEDSDFICDMAQGTVWKKLFPLKGAGSELCLRFSMFIDWFNPLKKKTAGKQSSIGLIALNCLNLPPCLL